MCLEVSIVKEIGGFSLHTEFSAGNETLALLGASGCGKSMTLRCIAGVEKPDQGRIILNGRVLFDSETGINLSPQERHVGMLFQHYALFPQMTVQQNVMCGVRRTRKDGTQAVMEMMKSFGIIGLKDRLPGELSGGQQQRTALARILVSEPDILMLDEPFSALDDHLHFRLEQELRRIIQQFGKPVILVSHNREEVYRLADRTAIMNDGRIEEINDTETIFFRPSTKAGCLLAGFHNISDITIIDEQRVYADSWGIPLYLPLKNGTAAIAVPPEAIQPGEGMNTIECRVMGIIRNPHSLTVLLMPEDAQEVLPLVWEYSEDSIPETGPLTMHIVPDRILQLKG